MMSVDELIREVSSIKVNSDELSSMVSMANTTLSSQSAQIAALVRGSHTGQEAVMAMSVASKGLVDAASSMRSLSSTCENCIRNLSK